MIDIKTRSTLHDLLCCYEMPTFRFNIPSDQGRNITRTSVRGSCEVNHTAGVAS